MDVTCVGLRAGGRPRRWCRSAGRWPTRASWCSTATAVWRPWACRRAAHRRRPARARLSEAAGPDGRALRARPAGGALGRSRGAALPHRRPRPHAARRRRRVPGPSRPPGEAARPAHRAGGDRGGARRAAGSQGVCGDGARRWRRRGAAGGLSRRRPRAGAGRGARDSRPFASGVHAADGARRAAGAPADRERQGGPQGPAGAGAAAGVRSGGRAAHAARRITLARPVPGRAQGGDGRRLRRLLRAGRHLDLRRGADQPPSARAGRDRPRGGDLRSSDRGPARRLSGEAARRDRRGALDRHPPRRRATGRCRSRSPRSGSGSSTVSTPEARPTT